MALEIPGQFNITDYFIERPAREHPQRALVQFAGGHQRLEYFFGGRTRQLPAQNRRNITEDEAHKHCNGSDDKDQDRCARAREPDLPFFTQHRNGFCWSSRRT